MAGLYPDAPGPRLAWDWDNTRVYVFAGSSSSAVDMTAVSVLNTDAPADSPYALGTSQKFVLVFPEPRNITGIFVSNAAAAWMNTDVSTNSTDGINGTWVNSITNGLGTFTDPDDYRTNIATISNGLGVRALRVWCSYYNAVNLTALHVYGTPTTDASNRIMFWDLLSDTPLAGNALDWGDVAKGSSADKIFRLKNLSATHTAASVTCAFQALTDTTPSVASQYLLSNDGVTFTGTLTLDLAPGTISPPIFVRRVTPTDAVLGPWSVRVLATVGEWQT